MAWAEHEPPPPLARLREAQALIDLRQMELAWQRLHTLLEGERPTLQAYATAAECLLLRDWSSRAREVLAAGLERYPDATELQTLWDRAAAANDRASAPPKIPPGDVSPDEHLSLAEAFLAGGQVLSARSLLERLHRVDPDHARVNDLRWASAGELPPPDQSLRELVHRASPSSGGPRDLEDAENTESITQEEPSVAKPAGSAGFPRLFRDDDDDRPADEVTEELTAAQSLSFVSLPDPFEERPTEIDAGVDGDTRVQRVIDLRHPPRGHAESPETDGPRPLDTNFYGVDTGALEDEDDDLIVIKHRTPRPVAPVSSFNEDPTLSQVGREVAHLLGPRRVEPKPVPRDTQDPLDPADVSDELELPEPTEPERHPQRREMWMWLVALVLVLVLGGALVTTLIGLILLQG